MDKRETIEVSKKAIQHNCVQKCKECVFVIIHTCTAAQQMFTCPTNYITNYKLGICMRRVCLAQKDIRKYASRYLL